MIEYYLYLTAGKRAEKGKGLRQMICRNCGTYYDNSQNQCPKCGAAAESNSPHPEYSPPPEYRNVPPPPTERKDPFNERLLCIIALVLLLIPLPALFFITDAISIFSEKAPEHLYNITYSLLILCPLAGIVLMIIARVKYPQSRFAKVVMWIYIVTVSISVILTIIAIVSCMIACNECVNHCPG